MGGAIERRQGLGGGYGQGPMKVDRTRNPWGMIEDLWQRLFGKKSSEWSAAEEAKDREARARVAEQEKRFYESRKQ